MEKGIEIVARYHCPKEYFVEVTTEKSVLAGRDYWLCKKNSPRKVFMFSGKFKNEDQEVHQIIDQLKSRVKKYEQLQYPEVLYLEGSLSEHRRYHKKYLL